MAKVKREDRLVPLRCSVCKRRNYYTRKNKKTTERKLELKKLCPSPECRKRTIHKETKLKGK